MTDTPPLHLNFDLASLSNAGKELSLKADAGQLERLAAWAGLSACRSFTASLTLSRRGENLYLVEGHFEAEIVQECVVTLEPLPSSISRDFRRRYQVMPRRRGASPPDNPVAPESEDDELEIASGSIVDLAAPVLEEFSLAIDPYPRSPTAELPVAEEAPEPRENPFAVLGQLKGRQGPSGSGRKR